MSQKVIELLKAAFESPALEEKLHAADNPESFVKTASELGYELTPEELGAGLGKLHGVFGNVVESMMDQLTGGAPPTNETSPTPEKVPERNAELVKRLFSRGEAFDSEGFITFFTDNPLYQFGNFEVCLDKESIKKSADAFFSKISAVYHEIKMMWEVEDVVFVEMDVTYWRKDGSLISLPCCDIFRVEGDKFSELRIFMDVNPVFDPSIRVPESASVLTVSGGRKMLPPDTMKKHFAEHPEGKERVAKGFAPKWSIDGPQWSIGEENPMSEQVQAVGKVAESVIKQDWEQLKQFLTDDVFYKVGSAEPVYGKQAVVDFLSKLVTTTAKFQSHDVRKIWDESGIVSVEMDASYLRLKDQKKIKIACCDIYRLRGNQVSEWRVYADMAPFYEEEPIKPVTIDKNNELFTVMVVFQVEQSRQQELVDSITPYLENYVKKQPGFVSSTLHKSLDGTRVVNYAQWKSREFFESSISSQMRSLEPKIFEVFPPDGHMYEIAHQAVVPS